MLNACQSVNDNLNLAALNLAAPKAVSEAFSGVVFKSMILSDFSLQDARCLWNFFNST